MKYTILLLILVVSITACTSSEPTPLEVMQECEVDEDCVYADNTCCDFVFSENIYAVNKMYKDEYMAQGPECDPNPECLLMDATPQDPPFCRDNVCLFEYPYD